MSGQVAFGVLFAVCARKQCSKNYLTFINVDVGIDIDIDIDIDKQVLGWVSFRWSTPPLIRLHMGGFVIEHVILHANCETREQKVGLCKTNASRMRGVRLWESMLIFFWQVSVLLKNK